MELSIFQIILFSAVLAVVGVIMGRVSKRNTGGESFLSRVFKDNKDFDSTLDRVFLTAIILFMLIAFHDDLTNVQTAGIVLALFNSLFAVYQSVVTGKAVRDLQHAYSNGNGNANHGNGKAPPSANH